MGRFLDALYVAARGSGGRLVFAGKMIALGVLSLVILAVFLSGLLTQRLALKYVTLSLEEQPFGFVATMLFYVVLEAFLILVFAAVVRRVLKSESVGARS
ncbi:MAG: hypothetical protein EON89_11885 [Brevundimonas sp.]|nr:MAG: hypothetical protein EON89_11885 [Brevundimonas sp.]